MNLNLSQYRKVKDDHKSATFKHPDGHEITVAKHVLSPKMRGDISGLPLHLDEGTPDQPVQARTEGMEEEKQRSNAGYQTQFPDLPNQQQPPPTQPTIIINNGQPQGQAPQPVPANNPNYDPNAPWQSAPFSPLEMMKQKSPDTSVEERQQIDKNVQGRSEENQKLMQNYGAKIQAYNQYAEQHGLPTQPLPPGAQQAVMNQAPSMAPDQATPEAPKGPSDPYGTEAYYNAYSEGLNKQKEGIQGAANAESTLAKAQEPILQNQIEHQQAAAQSYQDHFNELDSERKAFQQDLNNQHIDPQHYLNSLGVGEKISKGIGLILGGMGGGLMHQANPALEFMNKQISNDIEAQKSEMGKKENLLSANERQFGNLKDATQMTQLMQTDIVKNQLAQAAAKSNDPLVQARAKQAIGQLDMQAAPIMSQMAMRRAMLSGMQNGQMDPAMVIRNMVPEKQQAEAYKELKEANEQIKARDNVMSAFNDLNKTNTVGNRLSSPIQSKSQVNALRNLLSVELARAAAGRVNEYEFKAAQEQFPAVGDDAETIQKKMNYLSKFIEAKMSHPILESYGINVGSVKPGGRFGSGGQKKIQLGAPVLGPSTSNASGR